MTYERKIIHLEEAHTALEHELAKAEMNRQSDYCITKIKKEKLRVKDLIMKLKKLNNEGREFK